jgi:hypothetical protein
MTAAEEYAASARYADAKPYHKLRQSAAWRMDIDPAV